MLFSHFGVQSRILPNGIAIPPTDRVSKYDGNGDKNRILFLGRLHPIKQPHLFVQLAAMLPEYHFVMCGMLYSEGPYSYYSQQVLHKAQQLSNLEVVGVVPPDAVWHYLGQTAILVNTSKSEGFPNAFLEAWAWGVPVISLNVDPGGVMSKDGLGIKCETIENMATEIERLMNSRVMRANLAYAVKSYVKTNHNIENIATRLKAFAAG